MAGKEYKPWAPQDTAQATPPPLAAKAAIPASRTEPGRHTAPEISRPPSSAPPVGAGFVQTFGIDVRVAAFTVMIDFLLFGGELGSLGLAIPITATIGGVVGFIAYKMQRSWYGDDHDNALIKGAIIGLLTAIPAPISPFVAGPGGILGLIHLFRGKK